MLFLKTEFLKRSSAPRVNIIVNIKSVAQACPFSNKICGFTGLIITEYCQRKDSNLSLPRTSVQCITNYATLALYFGDSWNRTSVAMMQTPRNAIILYPQASHTDSSKHVNRIK